MLGEMMTARTEDGVFRTIRPPDKTKPVLKKLQEQKYVSSLVKASGEVEWALTHEGAVRIQTGSVAHGSRPLLLTSSFFDSSLFPFVGGLFLSRIVMLPVFTEPRQKLNHCMQLLLGRTLNKQDMVYATICQDAGATPKMYVSQLQLPGLATGNLRRFRDGLPDWEKVYNSDPFITKKEAESNVTAKVMEELLPIYDSVCLGRVEKTNQTLRDNLAKEKRALRNALKHMLGWTLEEETQANERMEMKKAMQVTMLLTLLAMRDEELGHSPGEHSVLPTELPLGPSDEWSSEHAFREAMDRLLVEECADAVRYISYRWQPESAMTSKEPPVLPTELPLHSSDEWLAQHALREALERLLIDDCVDAVRHVSYSWLPPPPIRRSLNTARKDKKNNINPARKALLKRTNKKIARDAQIALH